MDATEALAHWMPDAVLEQAEDGLINRTWRVRASPGAAPIAVFQWVNPIFPEGVEDDIQAVTGWLAQHDMVTPRLRPLADGALALHDDDSGHWRLMDYVSGRTLHRIRTPAQAATAGALVGRFHAVMAAWPGTFAKAPRRIHDTPARMSELQTALGGCDSHPLADRARALGEQILWSWSGWEGSLRVRERPCHGDLKASNLRFAEDEDRAICLIDLDTLGPQRLADELGDAWRSWCNPAGEDDVDAVHFDLDLFRAAASSWLARAPAISPAERASLVPGIERICLELAARFCADAVSTPTYFREDRSRFPEAGAHNVYRAEAQLRLARLVKAARGACERIVGTR